MMIAGSARVLIPALLVFLASAPFAHSETCHEKFIRLLMPAEKPLEKIRIHITTVFPDGKVKLNYHYSDLNGDGMTEMIDPVEEPWSLFIGDNMYSSGDRGKTWTFMNSYDKAKVMVEYYAAYRKDLEAARDVICAEEDIDGKPHEAISGTFNSAALQGGEVRQKLWVDLSSSKLSKSYSEMDSPAGGTVKTTSVFEPSPDFQLPKPD